MENKIKGVTIGLWVTKAFPPTTRPAAKIKKDGQEIKSSKGAATANIYLIIPPFALTTRRKAIQKILLVKYLLFINLQFFN